MELLIDRIFKGNQYTIGKLFVEDSYFCDTLEDPVRDILPDGSGKIFGQTAIPAGRYKVILSMSPKFGRILPEILNVPHFTGIRIHRGVNAEHTHGCPLVGINSEKGKVLNGAKIEEKLINELKKSTTPIFITIR
ncbi:MAG: hypothetical protein JXR39_11625 [Marinilabiliaceae bacterium]|nr:hypothetical protein [Marinilabiliaceae bacterium]